MTALGIHSLSYHFPIQFADDAHLVSPWFPPRDDLVADHEENRQAVDMGTKILGMGTAQRQYEGEDMRELGLVPPVQCCMGAGSLKSG